MGKCIYCGHDVFLKDEETRCDFCKEIVRYWCNTCKEPFDVENKEIREKVKTCLWCGFYNCSNCDSHFELKEKLTNNPTCKNLGGFKEDGESELDGED